MALDINYYTLLHLQQQNNFFEQNTTAATASYNTRWLNNKTKNLNKLLQRNMNTDT